MKKSTVKRKCAVCGEKGRSTKTNDKRNLIINEENIDKFIFYQGQSFHKECFIEMCNEKIQKAKTSPSKKQWEETLANLDKIQQETISKIESLLVKERLNDFIKYHYGLIDNPSEYVFTRLDSVYSGTFKGLQVCIPPEDLFDMWQRQINNLKAGHFKKESTGAVMDKEQKILYDISVLVGKYDSYLKWKENCKAYERDVNSNKDNYLKGVDLEKLSRIAQENDRQEEEDIDSLLDELF